LIPFVLAHWVMGSGISLQGRGIKLCIRFNNLFDTVKLVNVMIKYGLRCNLLLEKNKHSIYIYRSSLNTLLIVIKPYMLYSMIKTI
jgi:hypothetical protein